MQGVIFDIMIQNIIPHNTHWVWPTNKHTLVFLPIFANYLELKQKHELEFLACNAKYHKLNHFVPKIYWSTSRASGESEIGFTPEKLLTIRLDRNSLFLAFQKVPFDIMIQNGIPHNTHWVCPANKYTFGAVAHIRQFFGTQSQNDTLECLACNDQLSHKIPRTKSFRSRYCVTIVRC